MIIKRKFIYPAPDGEELRTAYVWLPADYSSGKKKYPVLYMFDGHNVFFDSDATYGKSWGMIDYMTRTGQELIIAALDCNHSPENLRLVEYSPYTFADPHVGWVEGCGEDTMQWFLKEFKPWVDQTFRTKSDRNHTFVAGSSMGGLMSLYALIAHNDIFSAAAALSPSIWTAPLQLEDLITRTPLRKNTRLYIDYGSNEIKFHAYMRTMFARMVSCLTEKGVLVTSRIVPGGDHCEACWEKQIPRFMDTLFYDEDYTK